MSSGSLGCLPILTGEMNENLEGTLAAVLVLAAAVGLAWLTLRYRAGASERRMRSMMRKLGLDPEIDLSESLDDVVRAIRRRCRQCGAVGECEAWLEGPGNNHNDFCPNARVFDILLRHKQNSA